MDSTKTLAAELDQIKAALKEAELDECRHDLTAFANYVMCDEDGDIWDVAPHQQEWFDLLHEEHKRTLIIAPRGHAKTTTVAAYIMWLIGNNPNLIIKYVCGDDDLAVEKFGFIYNNIITNSRYAEVFPNVRLSNLNKDEDTKHKFTLERSHALGLQNPTLQAVSVLSTGTGGRGHLIIFDDVADERIVASPALIPQIKYRVESGWLKTLYPGGKAIMIGTFWSFDPPDIHVEYSRGTRWILWQKPACYRAGDGTLKGPVLWDKVWPLSRLEDTRLDGEASFRQQYLLEGVVSQRDYFSEKTIQRSLDSAIMLGEGDKEEWPIFIGVDPAASLKRKGSFNALIAVTVRPDGKKLLKGLERIKDTPEAIATTIIQMAMRWEGRLQLILVENNAYQEALLSLIKVLAEAKGVPPEIIPLQGHFTGANKWSLDTGLPCVAAEMATGKWIFPYGGDHSAPGHQCNLCAMLEEMRKFPFSETKDMIMGLLMASIAANKVGRFGDLPAISAKVRRPLMRWRHR